MKGIYGGNWERSVVFETVILGVLFSHRWNITIMNGICRIWNCYKYLENKTITLTANGYLRVITFSDSSPFITAEHGEEDTTFKRDWIECDRGGVLEKDVEKVIRKQLKKLIPTQPKIVNDLVGVVVNLWNAKYDLSYHQHGVVIQTKGFFDNPIVLKHDLYKKFGHDYRLSVDFTGNIPVIKMLEKGDSDDINN